MAAVLIAIAAIIASFWAGCTVGKDEAKAQTSTVACGQDGLAHLPMPHRDVASLVGTTAVGILASADPKLDTTAGSVDVFFADELVVGTCSIPGRGLVDRVIFSVPAP